MVQRRKLCFCDKAAVCDELRVGKDFIPLNQGW